MISTRSPITDILQQQFAQHPELKARCLQSGAKLQRGDLRARIFDDFPCLLSVNDISALMTRLVKFLKESRSIRNTNNGIQIASLNDVLIVRQLQKDIARVGCLDLLDDKGEIKREIRELLGWNQPVSADETRDVLHAYVASINQEIIQQASVLKDINSTSLMGLCDCINKNYGGWTNQIVGEFHNPQTRVDWRKNRAKIFNNAEKPHIFNDSYCLLSKEDMNVLYGRFAEILKEYTEIKQVEDSYEGFKLINIFDKQIVKKLIKDVASISCDELLDKNDQVRKEIVKLLEWQEHLNQENVCEIIFDHVWAICQAMMSHAVKVNSTNRAAYDVLCTEINQNYMAWTVEVLTSQGIIRDAKRLEKIGIGIGVGLGVGALALASLAGIIMFKDYPSLTNGAPLDGKQKPKPPI